MKPLTEAQLMGYRSAMLPPSRRYRVDREPTAAEKRASKQKTATFSEEDARLAGHLGKDTYKKNLQRMLSIRARAFALRDVFADVLKGLKVAEEVEDYPAEKDITPAPASTQQAKPASRTSAVLDRIKSARDSKPVEPQPPIEVDHTNAYADHCAAIEEASDPAEWQQAYSAAWGWANETGDPAIISGIKQIAGERKRQLDAGHGNS